MIVLDEHLQGVRLEETIAQWYRGRVCFISSLRPGSVIKDESIPHLLRSERQPTFVTQNWKHFWHRTAAHSGFCIVCFVLPSEQVREIAPLLRRLLRLSAFQTRAARMGKVIRVSSEQVSYYQVNDAQSYVLSLP
jgi:hypothetical protein